MKKQFEDYLLNAVSYGNTQRARDFTSGNKFATKLEKLGKQLRIEPDGQTYLLSLLNNEDMYVRVWAAKDCLFFNSTEAVSVLEALGKIEGLFGTGARITLSEWRAGRLFSKA